MTVQLTLKQKLVSLGILALTSTSVLAYTAFHNGQTVEAGLNSLDKTTGIVAENTKLRTNRLQLILSKFEALEMSHLGKPEPVAIETMRNAAKAMDGQSYFQRHARALRHRC